ncbi:MAG: hypothetical protein IH984_06830 [Planctomycetes bacterium]|nr:hypothetical protein [Planctomycetota bacterium]
MNEKDPIFDDAFVANLPDDPWDRLAQVCNYFNEWYGKLAGGTHIQHHEQIIDAYALLRTVLSQHKEHLKDIPNAFKVQHNPQDNVNNIVSQFKKISDLAQQTLGHRFADYNFTTSSERYEAMFADDLRIEFHEDDIARLQVLINELRDEISGCASLEANHQYRLLRRLERLQKELHKTVSNLDNMWIFIGDAAFVLGKAAEDVKPMFVLIREMMGITRNAMARAHGLPAAEIQDFLLETKEVVTDAITTTAEDIIT